MAYEAKFSLHPFIPQIDFVGGFRPNGGSITTLLRFISMILQMCRPKLS